MLNRINLHVQSHEIDQAMELFAELKQKNVKLSAYNYKSNYLRFISELLSLHRTNEAMQYLDELRTLGMEINEYNSLIRTFARQKMIKMCRELLQEMKSKGLKLTIDSYDPMLLFYAKRGNLTLCVQILLEIDELGIPLSEWTFTSLMRAAKDAATCWVCFQEMRNYQKAPSTTTYAVLITAFVRGGRLQEGIQFLNQMKGDGLIPDARCYKPILEALNTRDDAETVKGLLEQMDADIKACKDGMEKT